MTKQLLNSPLAPEAKPVCLEMINARRCHGKNSVAACYATSREGFSLQCWCSRTFN